MSAPVFRLLIRSIAPTNASTCFSFLCDWGKLESIKVPNARLAFECGIAQKKQDAPYFLLENDDQNDDAYIDKLVQHGGEQVHVETIHQPPYHIQHQQPCKDVISDGAAQQLVQLIDEKTHDQDVEYIPNPYRQKAYFGGKEYLVRRKQ